MQSGAIVVGTDFSDQAQTAVELARQVASRMQRPLQVVHVWNTGAWSRTFFSGEIPLEPLVASARQSARAALDEIVATCRAQGCEASAVFEDGAASRVLPKVAEAAGATMIMVGRRGSAQLSHVLLGSVSERVVRGASCPVLVVPESDRPARLPTRLLVGVDFSSASREALRKAAELSNAMGCPRPLLLAHAYQDERADWLASWSETGRRAMRGESLDSLSQWATDNLRESDRFEAVLVEGVAEDVLPRTAWDGACDWICLGLQGRTALASFLVGSTTRRILELADRPVLVVPPSAAPDREPVG